MNINKYLELRANARKRKHQDGGIIKASDGTSLFIGTGRSKEDLEKKRYTKEDFNRDINALSYQDDFSLKTNDNEDNLNESSATPSAAKTSSNWTSLYFIGTPAQPSSTITVNTGAAKTGVRSDRNNNPLNIRFTNIGWEGKKTSDKTDNDFEEFESRDYGWRAAYKNIDTKMKRGLNTLNKLINEWAPPSENNTNGYVLYVSSKTGIDPDVIITQEDLPKIGAAMAAVESGRRDNIDWDDALRGFKFYLGQPV